MNIRITNTNAKFNSSRMHPWQFPALSGLILTMLLACNVRAPRENRVVWKKIGFDIDQLDANGLLGPPDGRVSLDYEFCIPAETRYWQTVQAIDSTAKRPNSRGRIGCTGKTWLVIGSTHRADYRQTLYRLAELPYVKRIERVYWE